MKQLNVVIPLLIRSFHCKIYIYIYIHTHTYVATIAHYWKHINTLNSEIYFWFDFFSSYCHLCYNLEVSTHFQTYKIDSPVLSATLIPWVLVGKVNNTRHHERVRKCGTSLSDVLQPSPSGRSLYFPVWGQMTVLHSVFLLFPVVSGSGFSRPQGRGDLSTL